jgi:Nuclease-related domain
MRLVELSNHPRGLLRDIHRQRDADGQHARARYERELAHQAERLKKARARRDEARARRSWWAWIRGIFAAWGERRRVPRQPVRASAPTGREESIVAGMAGERQVAEELGSALGNEWVLFSGYRNGRGEIDHLLAGPGGLFAIEVKHHNATVYIDRDDWLFEKFDRWGNRVEQGRIADRTGRSPSEQVNDVAGELERFLHSRGEHVSIARIVILNHQRSRVGGQRNATVRVTTSTRQIVDLVRKSPNELATDRVAQLANLIERDHRYHEARRFPRK